MIKLLQDVPADAGPGDRVICSITVELLDLLGSTAGAAGQTEGATLNTRRAEGLLQAATDQAVDEVAGRLDALRAHLRRGKAPWEPPAGPP